MFRLLCTLPIAIGLFNCGTVADCCGQITITQLPVDGTWARYEMVAKQDLSAQDDEDGPNPVIDIKGEVTIRSVGTEQVQNEAHRWIEIETRIQIPAMFGETGEIVKIVKMLVPEIEISRNKSFHEKVKKIIVFDNSIDGGKTKELDPDSAKGKQAAAMFAQHSRLKSKTNADKEIITDIGNFQCEVIQHNESKEVGNSGESKSDDAVSEEGGDRKRSEQIGQHQVDEKDDNAGEELEYDAETMSATNEMSYVFYTSDKSPFGLVKVTAESAYVFNGEKKPFEVTDITLEAIGAGAESAIDQKKLSDKTP